jgi:hypothetical protein
MATRTKQNMGELSPCMHFSHSQNCRKHSCLAFTCSPCHLHAHMHHVSLGSPRELTFVLKCAPVTCANIFCRKVFSCLFAFCYDLSLTCLAIMATATVDASLTLCLMLSQIRASSIAYKGSCFSCTCTHAYNHLLHVLHATMLYHDTSSLHKHHRCSHSTQPHVHLPCMYTTTVHACKAYRNLLTTF